jgi:ribosomal protein S2
MFNHRSNEPRRKKMTTAQQINYLRQAFGAIQTMDPCGSNYKRLCAILDRADDEALKAAHAAKIPFVSALAFNRMLKRGLVKLEA